MTAVPQCELRCDHPECEATFGAGERRADLTRALSIAVGWVHGVRPGAPFKADNRVRSLDFCPRHVADLENLVPKALPAHARST